MNVKHSTATVRLFAAAAALAAALASSGPALAVTASTVNAVGLDGSDNLTSLTIDSNAIDFGDLVGTTVQLEVSTANTVVRTVVPLGNAAPAAQATAAGHLSDGSLRTGQQVVDAPPFQAFRVMFDSNFTTGSGVDFVFLTNSDPTQPFLSFAPVDAGGTALGAEAISFDGNAIASGAISYSFYDITGLDSGSGWSTAFAADVPDLAVLRAYAINFTPGIEVSGVQFIAVQEYYWLALEAYGIAPASVPAPAALPAGLAMLGLLAVRRRR